MAIAAAAPSNAAARSIAAGLAAAVAFALLTWVGANIYIPLVPVPVTLQTLFVLLAGSIAGARSGLLAQTLYVGGGALGLPLFAGGISGLAVLGGPTGGYLVSFLVAPIVVSRLIRRSDSLAAQAGAFSIGTLVIFALGVSHLAAFYTHDLGTALRLGLVPFIPGAILKVVAAVSIHRSYHALARRYGRP
jgi:biotin transport system substrate-specific component